MHTQADPSRNVRRHTIRILLTAGPHSRQVTDASLVIKQDGETLLEVREAGPAVRLALAPGRYVVEAEYGGARRTCPLQFGQDGAAVVFLHFAVPEDERTARRG